MPILTTDEAIRELRKIFPRPPWRVVAATAVPTGDTWLVNASVHTHPLPLWQEFRRAAPTGVYFLWLTTAGDPLANVMIIDSDLLDRAFAGRATP